MFSLPDIIAQIRTKLREPLPGIEAQERMMGRVKPLPDMIPANARASAVLCLLFPVGDELNILFIKRTEDGRAHGGQISFPGGRKEPEDADLMVTALRETQEEVGLAAKDIDVLGALTQLYIPISNFHVHPFVGFMAGKPVYNISTEEVAYTLEVPLSQLLNPANKQITQVRPSSVPGLVMNVPAYHVADGSVIWGATAMILSELETVLSGIV